MRQIISILILLSFTLPLHASETSSDFDFVALTELGQIQSARELKPLVREFILTSPAPDLALLFPNEASLGPLLIHVMLENLEQMAKDQYSSPEKGIRSDYNRLLFFYNLVTVSMLKRAESKQQPLFQNQEVALKLIQNLQYYLRRGIGMKFPKNGMDQIMLEIQFSKQTELLAQLLECVQ